MWRIFQFLGRFGNFILFLVLELVALLIVVTFNKPQREISQRMLLETSGNVSQVQYSIGEYFDLRSQNSELQDQNARLMAQIELMRDSLRTIRFRQPTQFDFQILPDSLKNDSAYLASLTIPIDLPDSMFPEPGYVFMPARTINSTVHLNYNYITIDKGRRHGILPGMGLISPDGVAGQVTSVSQNYARALSLLNKKFNLSAKLLRNSNIGNLTWEGSNPDYATLQFIPQTSTIAVGDSVVTSGYSTTFPPNYFVGVVEDFDAMTKDGFFNIKVKLASNFRSLDALYVVMHEHRDELLDSLQMEGGDQ